jgi:hypothetical protein
MRRWYWYRFKAVLCNNLYFGADAAVGKFLVQRDGGG